MKTIFTRTIPMAEAAEMIKETKEAFIEDSWGAWASLKKRWIGIQISSITCGGYSHSLTITNGGVLTVEHIGARRSYPSLIWELIPTEFENYRQISEWSLLEYQTSEPTWAPVSGLLFGHWDKNKPENADEADRFACFEKERELKAILKMAGIKKDIFFEVSNNIFFENKEGWIKPLIFTGSDYRRLAAVGSNLRQFGF